MEETILSSYMLGGIVWGLICSFACYQIAKAKGYPDYACGRGMGWAYLLNIIWVIVALCRPRAQKGKNVPEEYDMPLREFVGLLFIGVALIAVAFFVMGHDGYKAVGCAVLFFAFAPLMALFGRI